mmetsp:Transcript_32427/g.47306  ORF Transcript_32427/g.47306 Transcript_32427/m.47306 type:complete len:443 (+) Transcript_32427:62-1390(+)
MTTVDWRNKAIEKAKLATDLDKEATAMKDRGAQQAKFQETLDAYLKCLDAFAMALKWEKNEQVKTQFNKFALEYMERAEKIKKMLDEPVEDKPKKAEKASEGDKDKNKMREAVEGAIVQEKPNVKWDDIAGLEQAKEALKEAVILPINFPQLFEGSGRKPWSGIMLYGPPGTGKSFLAKAVATEAAATFLSVSSADLTSKWLGESEKMVKTLFELARDKRPSIIFIDEIDSIATSRSDSDSESGRRIKTELLVQMDGLGNSVDKLLVLCATNMPWAIDGALLRRCQKRIYIPLPDERARKRLLEIRMHKMEPPPEVAPEEMDTLVAFTEGFSGSDLSVLVAEAIMGPVRKCQDAQAFYWVKVTNKEGVEEDKLEPCSPGHPGCIEMSIMELASNPIYGADKLVAPPVTFGDFQKTLSTCKASVGPEQLEEFEKFTRSFGQDG